MTQANKRPATLGLVRPVLAATIALALAGCAVNPTPVTMAERGEKIKEDFAQMYKDQEPLQGPLSLEEAMARAVKYNLETRLRIMEEALGMGQVEQARFDMLPRLT
ncbi:TolC family protein, partial [Massilia sp. TS11]|nr:TolC family protein [Massilia sp. TS11]